MISRALPSLSLSSSSWRREEDRGKRKTAGGGKGGRAVGGWKIGPAAPPPPEEEEEEAADTVRATLEALHVTKDEIGRMPRTEWSRHSRRTNPWEDLTARVGEIVAADGGLMCRAEVKMIEMLRERPWLLACPPSFPSGADGGGGDEGAGGEFLSVHVADAPGGFFHAVARELRNRPGMAGQHGKSAVGSIDAQQQQQKPAPAAKAILMTLRSSPGALPYDRRVVSEVAATGGIFWGDDRTGNVTHKANLLALWRRVRRRTNKSSSSDVVEEGERGGGCQLFTADGGFLTETPEAQEQESAALVLAEAVAAVLCCGTGGHAAIKIFEASLPCTVSVLAFLAWHFASVELVKPRSSRPANSERYVICRSLLSEVSDSAEAEALAALPEAALAAAATSAAEAGAWSLWPFPPPDWRKEVGLAEAAFAAAQTQAIRRALDKSPSDEVWRSRCVELAREWLIASEPLTADHGDGGENDPGQGGGAEQEEDARLLSMLFPVRKKSRSRSVSQGGGGGDGEEARGEGKKPKAEDEEAAADKTMTERKRRRKLVAPPVAGWLRVGTGWGGGGAFGGGGGSIFSAGPPSRSSLQP